MNREKPEVIKGDLEDLEIREKISDILGSIKKDRDYNPEDIDEEKITASLIDEFNHLPKDSSISKEGFLTTLEEKIRIIIIKKAEARIKERVLKTMGEFGEIEEKIHGKDKNVSEIPKAV
ncbi:MAG: hypothetical protein PHR36_00275 [Patescibacteria group bacterium]|nr:hypothetical protein [Patescibacteria group bacterium]